MKTIENLGCGLYAGAAYLRVNTVCVSQVGEHISLGIHVSQGEERISLGKWVSGLGKHISLGICVSQVDKVLHKNEHVDHD